MGPLPVLLLQMSSYFIQCIHMFSLIYVSGALPPALYRQCGHSNSSASANNICCIPDNAGMCRNFFHVLFLHAHPQIYLLLKSQRSPRT